MPEKIFLVFLLVNIASVTSQLTPEELDIFRSGNVTISDDPDEPDKYWIFEHDGIPNHEYGESYDENNTISAQNHTYKIPKQPEVAEIPGCLSLGKIAAAFNGIPFFNPYTEQGYNAVDGQYKETIDNCSGHPNRQGEYHYQQLPNCLYGGTVDEFLGVALDGYAIYGPITAGGKMLVSDDLDVCHGRMNNDTGKYEYRITLDFPYVMGCYKGVSTAMEMMWGNHSMPPEAMAQHPGLPTVGMGESPPMGNDSFHENSCVYASFCENPGAGNCTKETYAYETNGEDLNTIADEFEVNRASGVWPEYWGLGSVLLTTMALAVLIA